MFSSSTPAVTSARRPPISPSSWGGEMGAIAALAYETWWLGLRTTRRFFRVPSNWLRLFFFPLVLLLVFSQLYRDIVQPPAFGHESYLAYLAPGQIVFASFLAVGWSGYGMLGEDRNGCLAKLRGRPVARHAT